MLGVQGVGLLLAHTLVWGHCWRKCRGVTVAGVEVGLRLVSALGWIHRKRARRGGAAAGAGAETVLQSLCPAWPLGLCLAPPPAFALRRALPLPSWVRLVAWRLRRILRPVSLLRCACRVEQGWPPRRGSCLWLRVWC